MLTVSITTPYGEIERFTKINFIFLYIKMSLYTRALSINSLSLAYSSSVLSMTWNVTGTVNQVGGPSLTIDNLAITAVNTVSLVSTSYNLTGYGGHNLNYYTPLPTSSGGFRTYTNIGTSVAIPIDGTGLNLTLGQSYNFTVTAYGTSQAASPPFTISNTDSNTFTNSTNPVQLGNSCFLKGTKIRCADGKDIAIEDIKKGMLVSTLYHGDVAVHNIGYSRIHHSRALPVLEQLYTYPAENDHSSLTVTGSHSRLVDHVNVREIEGILTHLRSIYVTDDKIRLPACIDRQSAPYEKEIDDVVVYHIALEHPNECINYGIWANGRLMETCPKLTLERTMTLTLE